jgi:PRTRC genetic system protein E
MEQQKCRICGCTEDNCQQCINLTGQPCHWVEPDLCSACQSALAEKPKEMKFGFFRNLYDLMDGVDLTIEAQRINGELSLRVLPKTLASIKPVSLKGTPEELEEGFFNAIVLPVLDAKELKVDLEQFYKSIETVKADNNEKLTAAAAKKDDQPAEKKASAPKTKPAQKEVKKAPVKKEEASPEETLF